MSTVAEKHEQITKLQDTRDLVVRESWIAVMEARLVREKLQECYKVEGVNSNQTCSELANRYLGMIRDNKVQGYRKLDFS